MPRDWTEASSHRLENTSALVTGQPFSVGLWFKVDVDPAEAYLFSISDSGVANHHHSMRLLAADTVAASSNDGSTLVSATTANTINAGAWNSAVATFGPTTGTDRTICLNGGTRATQTTNRTPAGVDRYTVGCFQSGGAFSLFFDGLIAHIAVWNLQLTVAEEQAFCRGVHPFFIRGKQVVHYWPLWGTGSPEPDYAWGRRPLDIINSVPAGDGNPWISPWFPEEEDQGGVTVSGGGTTYNKAGFLVVGGLLAGTDVFEAAETGALTADTSLSGIDSHESPKAGSLAPDTSLSGTDVFEAAELGSLIAGALMSGVSVKTTPAYEKTGALITAGFLAGLDVLEASETGSLIGRAVLAGTDVFEASETGSLTSAGRLFGADVFNAAETGALTPDTNLSGADVFTAAETGTLMAAAFLAGTAQKAGTITKTGSLIASALMSGTDTFTATETGALVTGAFLAGARIREKEKAGALTPDTSLTAADVFTAAELGALVSAVAESGGRNIVANRVGSLLVQAVLSGQSQLASALTILAAIYTGHIGYGQSGVIDGREQGHVADTVGGLIKEDSQE